MAWCCGFKPHPRQLIFSKMTALGLGLYCVVIVVLCCVILYGETLYAKCNRLAANMATKRPPKHSGVHKLAPTSTTTGDIGFLLLANDARQMIIKTRTSDDSVE